jgi:uncharacterized protein (TIRG00374 family)
MRISTQTITKRLTPGLVLGFVVLLGLALLGDLHEVSQSLLRFRWGYFLVALALTLLNYGLRFVKWHYYIRQIGARNLSWGESLRLFVAGFPLAVTPGKVGEALKGVWLKRASNVPVGRGVAVVVAERVSDGLAVLILSTLGVITYPQYWPAFAVILTSLVLVIVISQVRPLALLLLGWGEKLPLVNRLAHHLREFYEGSFSLFRPGAVLLAVLIGTVSWLGEGIGLYCILLGLGVSPGFENLAAAVFVLSFSTAVGAASAMPGGLGAAEGTIAVLLPFTVGVQPAIAASATLLIRLATLWFGVALGLITWTFSMDLLGLQAHEQEVIVKA